MNYNKAKAMHEAQWHEGKHKDTQDEYVFPYNILYENEEFVEVNVQIEHCTTQAVDTSRVDKYLALADDGIDLGPSWVIYGKKLQNGDIQPFWHSKCYVLDGNHRLAVKDKQGNYSCRVIMPKSNYTEYKRQNNE